MPLGSISCRKKKKRKPEGKQLKLQVRKKKTVKKELSEIEQRKLRSQSLFDSFKRKIDKHLANLFERDKIKRKEKNTIIRNKTRNITMDPVDVKV